MRLHTPPQKIDAHCHAVLVYTAAWHYSLSETIREVSRHFAEVISYAYQHEPPERHYQVFSAPGADCWIIGISAECPDVLQSRFFAASPSPRIIERYHCTGNIALIIEHELNKMPVNRHGHNSEKIK